VHSRIQAQALEEMAMTTLTDAPSRAGAALADGFRRIDHFARADAEPQPGTQLRLINEAAPLFRQWFASTGTPDFVGTFDLVSLPYPTRFGLFRAHLSPAPYITITNRLVVIRWREPDGRVRTLLFEPSDVELGANTPYFARMTKNTERLPQRIQGLLVRYWGSVVDHLHSIGIEPAQVDYLTFDHLHTQDVRRWIGTNNPAADLAPAKPQEPIFANAKLIVQRTELDAIKDLHPLQRPWYQPDTYTDLRSDAIMAIDGDVQLGPGVALLATPGHTIGNHTLVLNTHSGIWASSENAVATECLTPEHSRIPGLRRFSETWGQEVVLNANTIEATAVQYNSLVKEKVIVDRSARDTRFLQYMPSSELTANRLNPGTAPTFIHGGIRHGSLSAPA
jgi:hypothetical protein